MDDNFMGVGRDGAERAEELFSLFRRYRIRWMGQASINVADNPSMLRAARESGCIFLFIGFESLSPAALKGLGKRLNWQRGVSEYRKVIERIHGEGISVMGSFIIGSDYDTRESIRELKNFIRSSEIDIPNITHLTPYPGTKLYEGLLREKRLFDPRFWLQRPLPLFTFEPENLSIAELKELTLELIGDYSTSYDVFRRFANTLKHTRSIRTASFSLAETLITARTIRQQL